MLDAKKIGYLRGIPASDSKPSRLAGPFKSMAKKMVATGHVAVSEEHYVRTRLGDEAMAEFDTTLSPACLEIISDIAAGRKPLPRALGMGKLVDSALVWIGSRSNTLNLTDDGKAIAARIPDSPGGDVSSTMKPR